MQESNPRHPVNIFKVGCVTITPIGQKTDAGIEPASPSEIKLGVLPLHQSAS